VSEASRPSLLRRIRNSWRQWRRGTYCTLDLVPDGFVYTRNRVTIRVLWDDIVQIDVGVRDLLTTDLLYATLHTGSGTVTIDEIFDGFRQFENEAFERWPQIRERWTSFYKGPPRQPRQETLWRRSA
jgi:hypothetical protein